MGSIGERGTQGGIFRGLNFQERMSEYLRIDEFTRHRASNRKSALARLLRAHS